MKEKTKENIHKLGWVAAAAIVVCTFWWLWDQSQEEPVEYALCKVDPRDIEESITAMGHLEAREEIMVRPQATGTIAEMLVKAGDKVSKGQPIARISVTPNTAGVSEAKNRWEIAQLQRDEAKREYLRIKSLYEKKAVARQDYEKAESAYRQAETEVRGAADAMRVMKTGESVATANATIVRSPISGTVIDLPVKAGDAVVAISEYSEGTTVAIVASMDEIVFKGHVDETEVENIRAGMPVSIIVGAKKGETIKASLEYISTKSTERNGTTLFEVKARASLPEGMSIRSGYSANAKIVTNTHRGVLSVDEAAVEFDDATGKAFVWILTSAPEDKTKQEFKRTPVELGSSDGLYVELTSGAKRGDLLRGLAK